MMIARLPVATKVAMMNALGLLTLATLILGLSYHQMSRAMEQSALATQDLSMQVAWGMLHKQGGTFSLQNGQLMAGDKVLNGDNALVDAISKATGGSATLFAGDNRVATNVIGSDGQRGTGTKLAAGPAYETVLRQGKPYRGAVDILGERYFAAYDPIKNASGETVGILYVGLHKATLFADFNRAMAWIGGGVLLFVLVTGLGAHAVMAGLLRPLGRLRGTMDAMRQGDLSQSVAGTQRADDVGDMARAVAVFREALAETEALRAQQEEARAEGERRRLEALAAMADTVERETGSAVDHVSTKTRAMEEEADRMAAGARRVGRNAEGVAAAAAQALSNAQTVSSATNQLTSSIQEISHQIAHAAEATGRSVEAGNRAVDAIDALAETVSQIGDVAGMIADIAAQTNLLALNATIEAARAGEAGKGFAVVASEVKILAGQTARATDDINRRVHEIQGVRDRALNAVHEIGHLISEVNEVSSGIAAAMEQQSAATSEIARNVEQTADAAREVSTRIEEVSQEAAGTDAAADHMRAASHGLAESVGNLRQTLVRVVRTSAQEVERRPAQRYRLERSATVEANGKSTPVMVENISEGGVTLRGTGLSMPRGILLLDGLRLSFHSLKQTDHHLHAAFDLDGADVSVLATRFADMVKGLEPMAA